MDCVYWLCVDGDSGWRESDVALNCDPILVRQVDPVGMSTILVIAHPMPSSLDPKSVCTQTCCPHLGTAKLGFCPCSRSNGIMLPRASAHIDV